MEKVLTISIAAYNVEKFIKETIESLIMPEILDDLDIIVCDDGGKDKSLDIAKEYEARYPGSIRAIHKDNGGYGSVFNNNIKLARGKYFKLLDGDDWLDSQALIQIIKVLKNTDSDVIVSNYYKGKDSSSLRKVDVLGKKKAGTYNISEFNPDNPIGMWALIYKTEVLKDSKLILPKKMPYTDMLYSLIPFSVARTIELFPLYLYCYRIGLEGQSTSKLSMIKNTSKILDICKMTSIFAEKNKSNTNYNYLLYRASGYHAFGIRTILLGRINKENRKMLMEYEREIQTLAPSVYNKAIQRGKIGKIICAFRTTHYYAYWILLLFWPDGIPNWQ